MSSTLDSFGLPLNRRSEPVADRRTCGGCDDCHAYQQLDELKPRIYELRIFHDDTCPTLARRRRPADTRTTTEGA